MDIGYLKYFLPLCGLSFDFLNGIFEMQKF